MASCLSLFFLSAVIHQGGYFENVAHCMAIYEAHRASTLESELQVLQGQNASLAAQIQQQESKREDRTPGREGRASVQVSGLTLACRVAWRGG